MTTNQIRFQEMKESQRANRAKEAETHRANVQSENLKAYDIATKAATSIAKPLISALAVI